MKYARPASVSSTMITPQLLRNRWMSVSAQGTSSMVKTEPPTTQNCPYFYANYLWNMDGTLINMEAIYLKLGITGR